MLSMFVVSLLHAFKLAEKCVCYSACKTNRIFAGRLHDLTEANADTLPLVALVRAQSLLQDGNNLWENLLSQLPHQIAQCPSSNLKTHKHLGSAKKGAGDFTDKGKHKYCRQLQTRECKNSTEWVMK